MQRRSFLIASSVILAGCNRLPSTTPSPSDGTGTATTQPGETATSSPTETGTATDTETESPTDTETPTETATDTETQTPELSDREQRAREELQRGLRELNTAVYTYAKRENGSLLDVSAATTGFPRIQVIGDIADADDSIDKARSLASQRQQPRVAAAEEARRFLTLAVDVQTRLIAAYGQASRARDAVVDEADGTIEKATRELRDKRRQANTPFESIQAETDATDVSIVPAIPTSDYEGKVAQFETEIDGFASLANFFDRLREAVVALNDAERFDRVESERQARESAREAATAFESLASDLEEFANDLSARGEAIEGLANDLADIAAGKAQKARKIEEENS